VPLLVGDRVLGVLHVGSLSARRFTEDETRLLQLIADRVALAVQARLFEADRTAARVLQRSLLPAGSRPCQASSWPPAMSPVTKARSAR